jgi:hypothetical protein
LGVVLVLVAGERGELRWIERLKNKAIVSICEAWWVCVVVSFTNRGGAMGHSEGLHRRSAGLAGLPERIGGRDGLRGAAGLQMRAMAVEFPVVHGHPNRLPFEGVLTLVDVASDKAPSGSRGHRVVLTRSAAEAALPSLLGMAVDYKAGWDGHDARQKCGIITAAEIDGQRLTVAGYLFARDFPEMEAKIQVDGAMGMSYELADAHVADMQAQVWTLTRATFTGAAILLREKAAYRSTSFRVQRPATAGRRIAVAR